MACGGPARSGPGQPRTAKPGLACPASAGLLRPQRPTHRQPGPRPGRPDPAAQSFSGHWPAG